VFLGDDGRPSLHATGHGDLPDALRSSGLMHRFVERGGRYIWIMNLDNLGAAVDPLVLGWHLERGAQLKLEYYDLWHFFPFGAFADDHHDRNALGPCAVERAVAHAGFQFQPEQVDVVGDTGHDIACGKAFGGRTIAVATGSWSRERLAECQPDFLFDDLAKVDEVKKTLGW
jgi:hypothetical protein